jgi:hypothetical protein
MKTQALLLLLVSACDTCQREPGAPAPIQADAAQRRVRDVVEPPVRAYPPHAIRPDGVGPYLLDQPLGDVLRKLPEGPNLEVLQLGKQANWLVVNAEGGQILVGAEVKGPVQFIAVVAPEVARTAAGIGVGATGAQLLASLGKARPAGMRNRLVYDMEALPGVRFITDSPDGTPPDKTRIIAVLVAKMEEPPRRRACAAAPLPDPDVLLAARAKGEGGVIRAGCFTSPSSEALVVQGGEAILVGGEPAKLRRLAAFAVAPDATVGPLDVDGDGRDDIVALEPRRGDKELSFGLRVVRWEANHLQEIVSARPFVVTEQMAAAAGVTPPQVDIAVEVGAGGGQVMAVGIYLATGPRGLKQVAPLSTVALRPEARRGAVPAAADAGDNR